MNGRIRPAFGKIYGNYEDLLADPEIDAIYLPLPNSLHAEWVENAARACKAVLCEKPLALNAVQAEGVVKTCAKHNVALMEGFMYRLHPQHRRVRELIGEVREVQAHLSVDIMTPADPAKCPLRPEAWRRRTGERTARRQGQPQRSKLDPHGRIFRV